MGIFATVTNAQIKGADEVTFKKYLPNSNRIYDTSNDSCTCALLGIDRDMKTLDFKVCVREYFQKPDFVADFSPPTIDPMHTTSTLVDHWMHFSYSERGYVVDQQNNRVILNSAPSFVVEEGDVMVFGQKAKVIKVVHSQTDFEFDVVGDLVDGIGLVSQKMQTVDLTELSGYIGQDIVKVNEAIPFPVIDSLVYLEDDTFEIEPNIGSHFRIAFQVTGDDNVWSDAGEVPTDFMSKIPHKNPSLSTGPLKLMFFAKNVSGDGVAKLNGWRAYFHKLTPEEEEE